MAIFKKLAEDDRWLKWEGRRLRTKWSWVQSLIKARKSKKYFFLFIVSYFGTYQIASKNFLFCYEFMYE